MAFVRKVSNEIQMIKGGCYQQYVIANAMECIPLPESISYEHGSMHFVNPITAIGLVEKTYGHKAVIQTAACG